MSKSKSSKQWLREHFNDTYVQKAQAEGRRSRAVFKLLEIQDKDKLIKSGQTVVDLGAAPGGWSQVAVELVGEGGQVFALDILPMSPIVGVEFICGDFREDDVFQQLMRTLNGRCVDCVISDMAPNMSGNKVIDQPRAMYLAELAYDFVSKALKPNGCFLVKLFHGTQFDDYVRQARRDFKQVFIRKPDASRSRSKEVYLLAKGYNCSNVTD